MNKVKEEYERTLNISKERYAKNAAHNSDGLKKAKQFFAARFGYIFASLNGHDGSVFDMKAGLQ